MNEHKCQGCGCVVVNEDNGFVNSNGAWCWECDRKEDIRAACEANNRFNTEQAEEKRLAETYPLCERLRRHYGERLFLRQFMEWANERGLFLCELTNETAVVCRQRERLYYPFNRPLDSLFMKFLDIDETALDDERRTMLDECAAKARRN